MSQKFYECFRHKERTAVKVLNVPCAPGGKLPVCAECDANPKDAFEHYLTMHKERVVNQRLRDAGALSDN